MVDIRKIKKLVELLEESGLAEIEISENDESVRLSRYPQHLPPAPPAYPPAMPIAATGPAPSAAAEAADGPAEPQPETIDGTVIRSPMVGTFYSSPNPESDPFVRVGQDIKAGDVVCMIEAMKMFNQIESEVGGKVVSVLVDNAQPVEFDQPLFIVR